MENSKSKKDLEAKESALLKRNNKAPGFTSSIVRSRSQLLIERYIQEQGIDLQEYLDSQRILKLNIPPEVIRLWYPTANWKKDIYKMTKELGSLVGEPDEDGNFDCMSLFSRATLNNTGLHLNIDPNVLQIYIITNGNPLTSIDYNLTRSFKCPYCFELYWQMCLHDHPASDFRFYLTPEMINAKYGTKYQNSNISQQIIKPAEEEIKALFDEGRSPRFFTTSERREVVGKCKMIIGWEFTIHNESRKLRQDIQAQEAYQKIDNFLLIHFEKFRINVLRQVKLFSSEKIIQIWMRLDKFEKDGLDHIHTKTGYLYYILQRYGINPRSPKTDSKRISEAPLFEKEEKDTAAGISYWKKCLDYINDSSASQDIKDLFSKLHFYSYIENEMECIMTFSTSADVHQKIETYFIQPFKQVLLKHFPSNLKVMYHVTK